MSEGTRQFHQRMDEMETILERRMVRLQRQVVGSSRQSDSGGVNGQAVRNQLHEIEQEFIGNLHKAFEVQKAKMDALFLEVNKVLEKKALTRLKRCVVVLLGLQFFGWVGFGLVSLKLQREALARTPTPQQIEWMVLGYRAWAERKKP